MRPLRLLMVLLAAALIVPAAAGATPLRWHTYHVKPADDLAAVRCPSTSLCVAVSHGGQVLTTQNPGARKPTWRLTAGLTVMGPEEDFEQRTGFNLACPSVHLCVTSDLSQIITTTNPTGPASAWHAVDIQPAGLDAEGKIDALTCPSTTLCVAALNEWSNEEGGGTTFKLATSSNPTGDASAWTIADAPPNEDYVTQMACSPGRLCAAGDDDLGVMGTTDAQSVPWTTVAQVSEQLEYVACPSISLCVGVDFRGRLASSTSPATTTWHEAALARGRYLTTVSCSSVRFCAATGGDRSHVAGLLLSSRPTSVSRWALTTFATHGQRLNSISCRSSAFCVAVGDKGLVVVRRRG